MKAKSYGASSVLDIAQNVIRLVDYHGVSLQG
jgi:hypothetical protein